MLFEKIWIDVRIFIAVFFEVSIKAPRKNAAGLADTIAQFLEGRDLLALL